MHSTIDLKFTVSTQDSVMKLSKFRITPEIIFVLIQNSKINKNPYTTQGDFV